MALFKISKGNVENLPLEKHEGYAYFTVDTKELYIDIDNNTRVQVNAEKLSRTIDNFTETIEIDDILELQDHIINTNNPHQTTAEQVGADPTGSAQSALESAKQYVDEEIAKIPTPDVSAQIEEHNTSLTAHANRNWVEYSDEEFDTGITESIDADLFGGLPPENYAKTNDLNILQSKVEQNETQIFNLSSNKLNISGGTLTGMLTAFSNNNYTTKQVRNIFLSTLDPQSEDGENGDIWIKYEE